MTTAECLPTAVLAIVLGHVPLQARLEHCALVCTTWKEASVAATTVIGVNLGTSSHYYEQPLWLREPVCMAEKVWDTGDQHQSSRPQHGLVPAEAVGAANQTAAQFAKHCAGACSRVDR